MGLKISSLEAHTCQAINSSQDPRTHFGDNYIYDSKKLHQKILSAFEKGIFIYMYECTYIYVLYIYLYICMNVCIYMYYIYIYIYV
jgi:hypothetical protein